MLNHSSPVTHILCTTTSPSVEFIVVFLSLQPLHLHGKHRINVEEKKEQSELFGRPRGGPRGGRGLATYRGPYRGGGARGGHFSSHSQSDSDGQTSAFSRQR